MSATEPDPHRRPRTAHYLGAVVIARRQITATGGDGTPEQHQARLTDAIYYADSDGFTPDALVQIAAEAVAYAEALDTERTTT